MSNCSHCGKNDVLTRKCNHCGIETCTEHILPEKHNCVGLRQTNRETKRFQSDIDAKLGNDTSSSSQETTTHDRRVATDRQGVTKDKKSKTPLDEYKNRQQAAKSARNSKGDASPDLNPGGSLKQQQQTANNKNAATSDSILLVLLGIIITPLAAVQKLSSPFLSKTGFLVVLLGVASAGQLGFLAVPGMPIATDSVTDTIDDVGAANPNASETTAADTDHQDKTTASSDSDDGGLFGQDSLNRTRIEYLIHEEINERRQQHGLQPIAFDPQLREIARYHSKDMAENQYFAHTSPSGETMGDRYDKFGYTCRVSTGGNRYATGAENIAYTYANERIRHENGETSYYSTEEEIAEGLVNGWMNSTGHRENILKSYWQNEGIGIYIIEVDGKTRVYATQNFC